MKRISILCLILLTSCTQLPPRATAPQTPVTAEPALVETAAQQVPPGTISPVKPQLPAQLQQAFTEAKNQLRQQHYAQAIAAFGHLAQQQPDAPGIWYNLAVAQWQSGQVDAARTSLQQATTLLATHSDSHNLLGVIARQQGDMRSAERHFQQALQGDASFAIAHKNLAFLYELYLQLPLQAHYHYKKYQQLTQDPQAEVWLALLEQELTQQGQQLIPQLPAEASQQESNNE